jgi:hypothetical protein
MPDSTYVLGSSRSETAVVRDYITMQGGRVSLLLYLVEVDSPIKILFHEIVPIGQIDQVTDNTLKDLEL